MAVRPIQMQAVHQPRLITVEECEQMIQAGVFPEDDRIELIEGQISNQLTCLAVPAVSLALAEILGAGA